MGHYLKVLGSDLDEGEYLIISALNAFFWAVPVFLLIRFKDPFLPFNTVMFPTLATFFLLLAVFLLYPYILVKKAVESLDRDLVYALKDLLIQISSGVSLFEAMKNVSQSEHGLVSKEFRSVVQDINAGEAQDVALEKLALRSESEFIKKTIWQIVIALRSGASLQGTLKNLVDNMRQFQSAKVKSYTQEMNLWILLYLIIAVAIPSLGATLITILSSFGSSQVREPVFAALLFVCFFAEYVIIKYVKLSRPLVYM
ncbi:MAG: type II secretion system F family protein [Candidatus Micrarchaeota archaeon]